jgi:ABC-type multidrug transport system ATPase subunit
VDALDLTVAAGEIFGLLGPNGAGKTTTVGMLTTTVQPTSGTDEVAIGRDRQPSRGYAVGEELAAPRGTKTPQPGSPSTPASAS